MKQCINCMTRLPRKEVTEVAWCALCAPCLQVVSDQMKVVHDRPGGAPVQIQQCGWCGVARSCGVGWRTRCLVCLDDRSVPDPAVQKIAHRLELDGTWRENSEFIAATTVKVRLAKYFRPGWTVLATDVHGLPWTGFRWLTKSHGTWGRDDESGEVRQLKRLRGEENLLYLMRYGKVLKFGRGTADRVGAHVAQGAVPVLVLSAPSQQVVVARDRLKRAHRSEMVSQRTPVDLFAVLPDGDDVTDQFPRS
ncbi:hypothetical protein SK854_37755 [Lentzea sp. BCCO 10_0061]|uniref:Uncharacterized protein n=1 Tax=Lentzea sokolovensis TaxID=3095429 RepID=A0ABU4V830_9PSEU|nr:hypothetical protein [Lentzea sp. BCCO 10_0061]MDX8147909.1 hypothetical protein [Lentzea sp. BCCO 10_0061]